MGKILWRLAIAAVLLGVAVYAAQSGFWAGKPSSVAPAVREPAASPPPAAGQKETAPAAAEPRRGRMELEAGEKGFTPAPSAAGDVSYTLKRRSSERAILPGVTVDEDRAVNIRLAGKDERIRITRAAAADERNYQVMWQKKY